MAIDLNAAKASKSSISNQGRQTKSVTDNASKDLATTTAQAIRGQVANVSKLVDTLAEQLDRVTDYQSDQMAEMLSEKRLWETTCAKTLHKLEVQEDPAPFEFLAIDSPPMSEAAQRYLGHLSSYGQHRSISSSSQSDSAALPAAQRTVDLPSL